MRYILLTIFASLTICAQAGVSHLLPKPQKVEANKQLFDISKIRLETPILNDEWNSLIEELGGVQDQKAKQSIEVELVASLNDIPVNEDEAYTLTVSSKKIKIQATNTKGVYWAMQTLRQLQITRNKKTYIEGCTITDYPAFRIRGFMQDVGRTYISIDELKKEIAKLAQYKINVFHWHLTENQGWRLETKLFPKLNDSTSYERQHGKFYTQEEAKDLVAFCKKHNVLLIPEFDMPGHSRAFEKAFGCSMQSKGGTILLKHLMDEVCDVFEDVPYLHIGTDEVQFTNPEFVPEMVAHIRAKGKKVISWNPGWNYKVGEIDMTQLWSYRGKPQKGIPAIDCRFHYANHFDAFGDLFSLYNSRIMNLDQGSHDAAGTIVAFWHDRYIDNEENLIKQNGFYPSLLAMAERAWMGGGNEYFDKDGVIIPSEDTEEFKDFKDFEGRLLYHKEKNFKGYPFAYVRQTNVKWNITDAFPNEGDLLKVFPPEEGIKDTYTYNGTEFNSKCAIGAGIYLRHVWGELVPAFFRNSQPNHTAYAYTYVYSPKAQNVGLWVNFQNYSRSEMDLAPAQGKWDYQESKIWLNDAEILPPQWLSTHTQKSNEIPMTNENMEVRDPIQVSLNKGWNKVMLKLPIGKFSHLNVRLVKWMFTCVFVTPNGEKAVDNLIYSPSKFLKK